MKKKFPLNTLERYICGLRLDMTLNEKTFLNAS